MTLYLITDDELKDLEDSSSSGYTNVASDIAQIVRNRPLTPVNNKPSGLHLLVNLRRTKPVIIGMILTSIIFGIGFGVLIPVMLTTNYPVQKFLLCVGIVVISIAFIFFTGKYYGLLKDINDYRG